MFREGGGAWPGPLRPEQVGVFTALVNLVQNAREQCSDYPVRPCGAR